MVPKPFSYRRGDDQVGIGVVWGNDSYDFTLLWEAYKNLKAGGRGPSLQFLQVMIELGFFELSSFLEVINTLEEHGTLHDFRLTGTERIDLPVARPQKVLCLGRNYREHAEEWNAQVPEEPIIFAKLPSALIPHEAEIRLPAGIGEVEHEIELAVVIGKRGKYIAPEDAWAYVAGYTVFNDVTARRLQLRDFEKGWPWLRSKSFDTFGPLGPYLVPQEAFPRPPELEMELRVNGEVRQRANTRQMVFDIPTVISAVSQWATLVPGDIICTGTPAGTGVLRPGDIVEAEIDGIGVLRNRVVGGERASDSGVEV